MKKEMCLELNYISGHEIKRELLYKGDFIFQKAGIVTAELYEPDILR